jgi:MFS family permease
MAAVDVNWLAVLGAALIGFIVGFPWYGALFGKQWRAAVGVSEEAASNTNKKTMQRIFSVSFILQFGMAYCLAMFIGNGQGAVMAALYGFLAGLPWVSFAVAVNAMYEQKPLSYIFINGGYWTVTFTLMGLVIGLFQ